MKKLLYTILLLVLGFSTYAQNNVYGKKVVGLDSVVTNSINARAGDVVTVLTALAVDQGLTVTGNATFSGEVSTSVNSAGQTQGAFNIDVATSEIAAISLDEDTRWWMWNGDGTLNNSLNFSKGTNYNSNTPNLVLQDTDAMFSGDVGIGQSATTSPLAITESSTDNVSSILLTGTAARKTRLEIDNNGTNGDHYSLGVGVIGTGNSSFTIHNEDTSTDEFQLLDGDATFSGDVTVSSSIPKIIIKDSDATTTSQARLEFDDSTDGRIGYLGYTADDNLLLSNEYATGRVDILTNATTAVQIDENQDVTFSGDMTFSDYGSGSNTGTAAYSLAVDASGNVIEETSGSFGTEIKSTGTAPRLLLKETDGTADRNLQFLVNGSELGFENLNDAESSNTRLTTLDLGTGDWDYEGNNTNNIGVIGMTIQGSDPSTATDIGHIYTKDVSASAEVFVQDEAGNATQISPHNFTGIPNGRSEEMAWSFYSERDGKYVNVDMLKLARLIESLTGEKLVYTGSVDSKPNSKIK